VSNRLLQRAHQQRQVLTELSTLPDRLPRKPLRLFLEAMLVLQSPVTSPNGKDTPPKPPPPPLTTYPIPSTHSTSSFLQMQPLLPLFHLRPLLPRLLGFHRAFAARSVGPGGGVYGGGVGPAFCGRLGACSSWLGLG